MKKNIFVLIVVIVATSLVAAGCDKKFKDIDVNEYLTPPVEKPIPEPDDDDEPEIPSGALPVKLDPETTYQTIEGFAASDAAYAQMLGAYWSNTENEKAAKWLFDTSFDTSKNPNGIGLSMYRFQFAVLMLPVEEAKGGEKSGQKSYLNVDGTYDFNQQKGQQWYLERAKSYGVNKFIAYTPGPVRCYTKNNSPNNPSGDWSANIQNDKYDDLALYYANVLAYYRDQKGIAFDYYSPVNEPQWQQWTFRNQDIKKLVVALNNQFIKQQLTTKIVVSEASQWQDLYGNDHPGGNVNKQTLNQIEEFYNPAMPNYIGNLPSVAKTVSAHSYFTGENTQELQDSRPKARLKADSYGLNLWQTEWCFLSDPTDGFVKDAWGNFNKMDYALQMARVMYADLAYANVTSWHYWTIWNFGDGKDCLIKVNQGPGSSSLVADRPGTLAANKTLWTLGNYSLFVRPGYTRIKVTGADNLTNVFGSAYISPEKNRIVLVLVNMSYDTEGVDLFPIIPEVGGKKPQKASMYRTDYYTDLKNQQAEEVYDPTKTYKLRHRSVNTLVFDF